MEHERAVRSKAKHRGRVKSPTNVDTSSDESTISTPAPRLRSYKRKSIPPRKERNYEETINSLPGVRSAPWPPSSDSSPPISPEFGRSFTNAEHRHSVGSKRGGKETWLQNGFSGANERGLRNIINFSEDSSSKRHSTHSLPETVRAPKASLDRDRRFSKIPEDGIPSKQNSVLESSPTSQENKHQHTKSAIPRQQTGNRHSTGHPNDDINFTQLASSGKSQNEDVSGRPIPIVDPRKMLQLMRTTRGRMQGNLYHRDAGDLSWVESHCFIDADSGCLCQSLTDSVGPVGSDRLSLIRDLRKCKAQALLYSEAGYIVLHLTTANNADAIQVRPTDPSYFNAWFAALLCWSSVPLGQHLVDKREQHRPNLIRQISNFLPVVDNGPISNPIRKVGAAILVEIDENRPMHTSTQGLVLQKTTWTNVSCLLNARGELRLLSKDLQFLATVHLAELPRSAIQRIGPSVLGADCVIAVYPQYAQSATACSRLRPFYLSFESRELYEVWFVLFRAHAIPELYGSNRMQAVSSPSDFGVLPGIEPQSAPNFFRIERSLHLRLNEARIWSTHAQPIENGHTEDDRMFRESIPANHFVEVLLDGQVKAKSTVQCNSIEPMWFEQFDFYDFATALSSITIRVKKQEAHEPMDDIAVMSSQPIPGVPPPRIQMQFQQRQRQPHENISTTPFVPCGEALIEASTLSSGVDIESWLPLVDELGRKIGEVSVKLRQEEDTVLMDREYDAIFNLLRNFRNSLTLQIYERIPLELGRLSVCLLNIFQVSGLATEWLMSLAEEEVDGVREPPQGRSRVTHRLNSSESRESLTVPASGNREDMVRELNKSATQEANLLFRGNTLLSKALDFHMRRVGQVYLDQTVGGVLRQIAVDDIECEVDPSRMLPGHDVQKSWRRLLDLTGTLWQRIQKSATKCPPEMRSVFRHIRACADDRFGDYMRTVSYSSVSGFLFLRFFCAAVLNPHLFGLLNMSPGSNAMRTYILIAKSLNGLASMTTFGSKEPWMKNMNAFLARNRQAFKNFIDDICSIPSDEPVEPVPTSYRVPIVIFSKMPLASREGFPSLPYLIDRARNLAALAEIWLSALRDPSNEPLGHALTGVKPSNSLTGELARFHDACLRIRQRTRAAWHAADRSEKIPNSLTHKWVATAERMESRPEEFWGVSKGVGMPSRVSSIPEQRDDESTPSKGSERRRTKEKSTFGIRSPSARRSKQEKQLTSLVPPAIRSASKRQSRDSQRRPVSSSHISSPLDTTRTVASAAQLTGTAPPFDAGLAFSSAPESEDEIDPTPFVLRQRRPNSSSEGLATRFFDEKTPDKREGEGKRIRHPYIDLTLTPESLHGRALGLGAEKKGDAPASNSSREGRRSFWGRKKDKQRVSEGEGEGDRSL